MTNSPSDAPTDLVKRLEAFANAIEDGLTGRKSVRLGAAPETDIAMLREAVAALTTIERETMLRCAKVADTECAAHEECSDECMGRVHSSKNIARIIRALSPLAANATEHEA